MPLWVRSLALRILTAGTGTNSTSQNGHGRLWKSRTGPLRSVMPEIPCRSWPVICGAAPDIGISPRLLVRSSAEAICRAVRQLVGCSAGGAPESRVWASAQSVEWPVSARDEAPDRVVPGGAGRKTGGTGKEKSGAPAGQHRTGGGQAGGRALRGRTDGSGPLRGADREITFGKHVAESAASL